jgi:LacI family transcriptional regulator
MEDGELNCGDFCCLNPRCVVYGRKGQGNLRLCGWTNAAKTIRQFKCRTCGRRFSSRKGTVFYRSRMGEGQVIQILEHVFEGCGMRQTGRLTRHKEDTVIRYTRLAGEHAELLHEQVAAFSPSHPRVAVR